jgi:organic hydroperoxide reductase OsmC/OhrA
VSEHRASVRWQCVGDFRSGLYGRAHDISFDGGAMLRGSSSPTVVPEPHSDPAGVDPEESLIASASACHMLWFLDLARREGLDLLAYEDDAVGTLGKDEAGRMAITSIILNPRLAFAGDPPDADVIERLHHRAHESCFIANTLRCPITVLA